MGPNIHIKQQARCPLALYGIYVSEVSHVLILDGRRFHSHRYSRPALRSTGPIRAYPLIKLSMAVAGTDERTLSSAASNLYKRCLRLGQNP